MGLFSQLFGKNRNQTDETSTRKPGDKISLFVHQDASKEEIEIGKHMAAMLAGAEFVKEFTSRGKPICPYCNSVVDVSDDRVEQKKPLFSEPLRCNSCGKIMDWRT